MTAKMSISRLTLTSLAVAGSMAAAAIADQVDIRLAATEPAFDLCDTVRVELRVQSDGVNVQEFDAIDAVFTWDPSELTLIGFDNSDSEVLFLTSGFLPDGDDINDDLTDGDAIFTGLIAPGFPGLAPPAPDEIVITTLLFLPANLGGNFDINLIPSMGNFAETRALLQGLHVTGAIDPTETIDLGSCAGDVDLDGTVDVDDLLQLLANWGTCTDACCVEDLNLDGEIDVDDLLQLLANWGPCI